MVTECAAATPNSTPSTTRPWRCIRPAATNWNRWNDAIRDAVVANQTKGTGCDRGSWDPRGTFHGDQGGRIYSTALATLMLEVYYRFSREEDRQPLTGRSGTPDEVRCQSCHS